MDTKSSKCVHLVEGGTNGSQDVNMAPMGKTSLGRVIHARKRQKTSFTNLETHGDGSGYLACDTCSSGVPNEIVPAGIVPIGNIPVGNNIGFQTRTKGGSQSSQDIYSWFIHDGPQSIPRVDSTHMLCTCIEWFPSHNVHKSPASQPLLVHACPPPQFALPEKCISSTSIASQTLFHPPD